MTQPDPSESGWLVPFRIGFAGAACWHLLGNAAVADGPTALLVGLGAAAVAWRPRSTLAFAVLTAAIWVSIWHEAPVLGNHWLLAGFIGLAGCAGSLARGGSAAALASVRVVVLVFYAFAAFAKLNTDFFDPSVSCATFYLAESANSFGWHVTRPRGGVAMGLILVVAVTELSIPVLLVMRRTRLVGVALAVVFHAVLALDHRHQFFDFSSVLIPVFATFLPPAAAVHLRRGVVRQVRPVVACATAAALAASAGLLVALGDRPGLAFELGYWSWQITALVVVPSLVVLAYRARRWCVPRCSLFGVPGLAIPIVALVVANGVAPYLEVKTGTAWNMYANLRTAGGDSNHYLVRATLPIGGGDQELVEIIQAEGPLAEYGQRGLLIPRRQLRWFLQTHPESAAMVRVDGLVVEVVPGRIPTELGPPVPDAVGRLLVLRAVPPEGQPVGCSDVFLPAT